MKEFFIVALLCATAVAQNRTLPEEFLLGFATSSYQIEGGWNEDGRTNSTWDYFTHTQPDKIADKNNGDVACDSYHKYEEDVQILKDLGAQIYRFSMSWSRILPNGINTTVNQAGIDYYNNLIDQLLANGIQPMVTLLHGDVPQRLQDIGGWTNPVTGNYFVDYARVAFSHFGDRVKWWATFNEPLETAKADYAGTGGPPGLDLSGVVEYMVAHAILQAHARAYHLYDDEFRSSQNGNVGIVLDCGWNEPLTSAPADIVAADRANQFLMGMFAHPIFSATGDYPPIMRRVIDENSKGEGWGTSRLPILSSEMIQYIKGTADFYGMNHYTTYLTTPEDPPTGAVPSWQRDIAIRTTQDPNWPTQALDYMKVVPWGIRKNLNWIRTQFGNVPIFITENGYSDFGGLEDDDRINMYNSYLQEVLNAIYEDGCNVLGYTAWSLMDNFEWTGGYIYKFGVYSVDFNDPDRPRTAKKSAGFFKDLLATRTLPELKN